MKITKKFILVLFVLCAVKLFFLSVINLRFLSIEREVKKICFAVASFFPNFYDFSLTNLLFEVSDLLSFYDLIDSGAIFTLVCFLIVLISGFGLIQYIKQGKTTILLFITVCSFINSCFNCLSNFVRIVAIQLEAINELNLAYNTFGFAMLNMLQSVIYAYVFYRVSLFLLKLDNVDSIEFENLYESSKLKRFTNYIVDTILFFSLILNLSNIRYILERGSEIYNLFSNKWYLAVLLLFTRFLYYFITEYLFDRSPSKILSKCYVITESGDSPSFINYIERTFLRFIPFEPLLFLFDIGVHDSVSGTQVVDID